jgi:serine/threonine-protein kinase
LNHPNILALHDFGTTEGVTYAVTELLEGETLRSRLESASLPPRRAVDIAIEVAYGLAATHGRGIVHRDLKPENIFLTNGHAEHAEDLGRFVSENGDEDLRDAEGARASQRSVPCGAGRSCASTSVPSRLS